MVEKVKKGRGVIGKRAAALLLVFCVLVSLLAIPASATDSVSYWTEASLNGLVGFLYGNHVWSDGANIYFSYNDYHFVLNGDTWSAVTWNGLSSFNGEGIWTDGSNIYYSCGTTQYVLNGDTWIAKTWYGLASFYSSNIWSDGTNIYCSSSSYQRVLDGDTWVSVTWNGLSSFSGSRVWTDGTNIYFSKDTSHYVLDGDTWTVKTWDGLSSFYGDNVWTDGTNFYYSYGDDQYVLNGDSWTAIAWGDLVPTYGSYVWSDGTCVYYSFNTDHYVFSVPVPSVTSIIIEGFPDSCETGRYIGGYAVVSGTGDFDPSYTMTLSGGTSSDTKLTSSDGVQYDIDVGRDETAETLTLTAISTADPSITDTHIITVKQAPTVTAVTVSPPSVNAFPGTQIQFTATVSGTGDYNTGVMWSVDESASSGGVTVDGTGLVTVPDTFTGTVVVCATALGDSFVYAEASVSIQAVSGGEGGSGDTDGETSDPAVSPTPSIIDQEKNEADIGGNSAVDDMMEVVPDYSAEFIDALMDFVRVFAYDGTEAVLPIPAIKIPGISGLIPETVIFDGANLDFGDYIVLLPSALLLLVQSLLTIALIVYCFKELYDTISFVLTLRRGSGSE